MDCSPDHPIKTSYPDLPLVAGNRVECSCVFESNCNESNSVEALVSCMDQSLYYITRDSVNEINIAVHPRGDCDLGPRAGADNRVRGVAERGFCRGFFGSGVAGRVRSEL